MSFVDQAAEVLMALECQNDTDRLTALAAADLLRPEWATPEAKAVLAALAKRAEASDALAAYHATTPEHVGMSLHWTRLAQDYSDADDAVNTAFDAYVASLGGAT